MPAQLMLVSAGTIGFLFFSVMAVGLFALIAADAPLGLIAVLPVLTVVFGLLQWAFGPWVMDFIMGYTYNVEKLEFDAFERRFPTVGHFMRGVCEREGMPVPQIRLLRDDNPTAFTYGSLPSNARVAFSAGLFRFCDDDEVCAVGAHELGHIRHYDFALMTAATVLLSLLYQGYVILTRSSRGGGEDHNRLWAVGVAAYVAWWIGTYLIMWLSRSREYMADWFAAHHMGDQAPLQRALVKIAYGLAELQVEAEAKGEQRNGSLMESTRALGIADPKAAMSVGNSVRMSQSQGSAALADEPVHEAATRTKGGSSFRADLIEPVFLYDLYNPWAMVLELGSTHPLTGKRLRALDDQADELQRARTFKFEAIDQAGQALDKQALYGDFAFEVVIWYLWAILPLFALPLYAVNVGLATGAVVFAGALGWFICAVYRYSFIGEFEPTTVYDLMCDPYASPLRGRPVALQGTLVGRAEAGSKFSEDMTLKDRSGALIMLDYESPIPVIGNLWFGWKTVREAVGKPAAAQGWFRRGVSQYVELYDLDLYGTKIGSWGRFWGLMWPTTVLVLSGLFMLASTAIGFVGELGAQDDAAYEDVPRTEEGVEVW